MDTKSTGLPGVTPPVEPRRGDRDDDARESEPAARVIVSLVWLTMLVVVLGSVFKYGHNVPLSEDWLLVPPLTGHERDLAGWLWEQNNEHRVPLPKLVHLGLLELTGGDFRAGMVFNGLTLAALSWSMMHVARKLRGGVAAYADAFFPIALLHLGHWPNLIWSWQIQFVASIGLACALLVLAVGYRPAASLKYASVAGICLVGLPLTGASGLAFALPLAAAFGYDAVRRWKMRSQDANRFAPVVLVVASVASVGLIALYFVGYDQPAWAAELTHPFGPTVKTAAKFLAFGLGPAAIRSWELSTLLVLGILLATGVTLLQAIRHPGATRRMQAIYLTSFLVGAAALAAGVAWGRATNRFEGPLPTRYALLAVPTLCVVYYAWTVYGRGRSARLIPSLLFATMLILLPINFHDGFEWGSWYRRGMNSFERDLTAGVPRAKLARRHQDFLLHWDLAQLKSNMAMLGNARIGPFRNLKEGSPAAARVRPSGG
jgi:hypothetical protein